MTIADFQQKIALGRTPNDQGYYPPKVQSIIRTPSNAHRVTAGDLRAARGEELQAIDDQR